MSFLKDLKIAVINRDLEKLKKLANKNYEINSIEEANELLKYIIEAKNILEEEKTKLKSGMDEIKKLKKYYENNSDNLLNFKL
jgi:orotate phosphoribosyltransferase